MRHTIWSGVLLAVLAAASLPAQDARAVLQQAIVVEEQQHDLGKAEGMYRQLYKGGALGDAERAECALRLGRVLQRLGKQDEAREWLGRAVQAGGEVAAAAQKALAAQGQDGEREKELRAQARELVKQALSQTHSASGWGIPGIGDPQLAQNLLWIGQAAVPEITAALAHLAEGKNLVGNPEAAVGLLYLLWKHGGQEAESFLANMAANAVVGWRVSSARAAAEARSVLPPLQAYLRDATPGAPVQKALVGASHDFITLIPFEELLAAAGAGSPAVTATILRSMATHWRRLKHPDSPSASLQQVLPIVREGLRSTDPEFGRAAQDFLLTEAITCHPEGIELLLRQYSKLDSGRSPASLGLQPHEAAMRLLPVLLDAARAVGPVRERDSQRVSARQQWLGRAASAIVKGADATAFPQVIELIELGYDVASKGDLVRWLGGGEDGERRFTGDQQQAEAVLACLDRAAEPGNLLAVLGGVDLSAAMWPLLRRAAESVSSQFPKGTFLFPVACTGVAESAGWMLQLADQHPQEAVLALIELGRRTDAAPVRAAMCELLLEKAPQKVEVWARARLFLVLAHWGDPRVFALDQVEVLGTQQPHPFGGTMSPVQYLLGSDVRYPHGFTPQQLTEGLRAMAATMPRLADFLANELSSGRIIGERIPTALRVEIGRMAVERLSHVAPDGSEAHNAADILFRAGIADNAEWLQRLLQSPMASVRRRAVVELASRLGREVESLVQPMLGDADPLVRMYACGYFGGIVSKAAVPELLQRLKDTDANVRTAAAEALQKIRFYHEQQAHWDRVFHGVDASIPNAAEKLLGQAKPTAPKDQRLLAIRSLAALGAPEALPFLIDYLADTDADIAAAARAAITAIHQRAGVK